MTRLEDRQILVRDIDQACADGSRLAPACALAGIDARTLWRWKAGDGLRQGDRRPDADRSVPSHALSEAERARIIEIANEPRFWLVEKHGTRTRRSWRKLHLGVDAGTGQIVAVALTSKEVDDAVQVGPLLDQATGSLASVIADGAYDQDGVYADVAERHPDAAVIVPPRRTAVLSDQAATAPTQRDRYLQRIAEKGRMAWQKASDYNKCAKIEAVIRRWKQVIGDDLRSRIDERRVTEINVAVDVLNRMLELGRLNFVRIV